MHFEKFSSIPRLFRDMIVTEKIDGTNAAVVIERYDASSPPESDEYVLARPESVVYHMGAYYIVGAQSRNRLLTPENDNQGFARWVSEHAATLVHDLGEGRHFGEWYGSGIQRRYGLDHKRFALFNASRWPRDVVADFVTPNVDVVPVLYSGPYSDEMIRECVRNLQECGSELVPGFRKPEGVVVYHVAARQTFKVLCESDELPKSVTLLVAA